jgi:hypothetical protein
MRLVEVRLVEALELSFDAWLVSLLHLARPTLRLPFSVTGRESIYPQAAMKAYVARWNSFATLDGWTLHHRRPMVAVQFVIETYLEA